MDAVVFFLVAVLVSTILLCYSSLGPESEGTDHGKGSADPEAVLYALMRSSIGHDLTVQLDIPRHVSGRTDVGQCLILEAEGLLAGIPSIAFAPINDVVGKILSGICSPVYEPYLSLWIISDTVSEALARIPEGEPTSEQRYGASVEMRNTGTEVLLVQLLLCPPSLPELVHVLGGDLDLRAGVSAPSPELDPGDGHHYEYQNERRVQPQLVVAPDIDQEHGRGDDIEDVEQVGLPGVRDLDGGGIAEADRALVLDLVPVLHLDILASRAVEELHESGE